MLFNDVLCSGDKVLKISQTVFSGSQSKRKHLHLSVRKKAHTKAGIIPELPLFGSQHLKKSEESRRPAKDELKDKQSVTEQRGR